MRFSLVALTALGIASVGLYMLKSRPDIDLGTVTQSVTPDASSAVSSKAPRPAAPFAEKTERIVAQLLTPNGKTDAKSGPSSLVIAQSPTPAQTAPPLSLTPAAPAAPTPAPVTSSPAVSQKHDPADAACYRKAIDIGMCAGNSRRHS